MNRSGSAALESEVRNHPLTFVLTLLFAFSCALGLIYIFAFSDTARERWEHTGIVFVLAASSGTALAVAKKREDRAVLPIRFRRLIWAGILIVYAIVVFTIVRVGSSPFARFIDTVRLLCYAGSVAPLAFLVWQLLRSRDEG